MYQVDHRKYLIISYRPSSAHGSLPITKVTESRDDVVVFVKSLVYPCGDLYISYARQYEADSSPSEVWGIAQEHS
jgi:hypothetical protein